MIYFCTAHWGQLRMEASQKSLRKQRRSSAIAVTTETQHLLECIQCTVQVNDDIATLHDLFIQLGSPRDSASVRQEINHVVRHCLETAKNARERFLYIVLNCRENVKLQSQAGQQLGNFGFCLTYMQGELRKGLQLVMHFPLDDQSLTQESLHKDMDDLEDILHTVEKHVHYISPHRPSTDTEPPELYRSKSYRIRSRPNGISPAGSLKEGHASQQTQNIAFCTGFLCMPTKKQF